MSKRKRHTPEFKAQVALEALKGEQTVAALARRSDLRNGYRNRGDVETRVLWVNTPPTF